MDLGVMLGALARNAQRGRQMIEEQEDRRWQEEERQRQRENEAFLNQTVGDIDPNAAPLYKPMKLGMAIRLGYKPVIPEPKVPMAPLSEVTTGYLPQFENAEVPIDPETGRPRAEDLNPTWFNKPEPAKPTFRTLAEVVKGGGYLPQYANMLVEVDPTTGNPLPGQLKAEYFPRDSTRESGGTSSTELTYKQVLDMARSSWNAYANDYNKKYVVYGRVRKDAPPFMSQDQYVESYIEKYAPQFLNRGGGGSAGGSGNSKSTGTGGGDAIEALKKDPLRAVNNMIANATNPQGKKGSLTAAKDIFKRDKEKLRQQGWPVDMMQLLFKTRIAEYNKTHNVPIKW